MVSSVHSKLNPASAQIAPSVSRAREMSVEESAPSQMSHYHKP